MRAQKASKWVVTRMTADSISATLAAKNQGVKIHHRYLIIRPRSLSGSKTGSLM